VSVDVALLEAVRSARRMLADDGPLQLRSEDDFDRVSIPISDCDDLRDLLVAENARAVLEIGLGYGSSAPAIAEALVSGGTDGTLHLIIDAFQDEFHDAGWRAITSAGLSELCTLVRERSQLALPRFVEDGVVADAAFVDGSHVFHNVFVDLVFFASSCVRKAWSFSTTAAGRQWLPQFGTSNSTVGGANSSSCPTADYARTGFRIRESKRASNASFRSAELAPTVPPPNAGSVARRFPADRFVR
jgi:hypothetical protein